MKCVKSVMIDSFSCLKPCSGLIITTLAKSEQIKDWEQFFPIFEDYDKFKKLTPYPDGEKGY